MKALTEGKDSLVSLSGSEINKKGISLVQRLFSVRTSHSDLFKTESTLNLLNYQGLNFQDEKHELTVRCQLNTLKYGRSL